MFVKQLVFLLLCWDLHNLMQRSAPVCWGWIRTAEDMNEKGNEGLQAMLSPLLIFRGHFLWIRWASGMHCCFQWLREYDKHWLWLVYHQTWVHGDIADVRQASKGTCLPSCLQWDILCKVLSFSVDMLSTFPTPEHSWASRQMFWI